MTWMLNAGEAARVKSYLAVCNDSLENGILTVTHELYFTESVLRNDKNANKVLCT